MKSIRRHLVLRLMIGATVLLGVTCLALYYYSRAFLIAEFDAALRSKALALVTLTKEEGGKVELHFADEFMPEFERRERPEYFQVWLANGAMLERSRSLRGTNLPSQAGSVAHPVFWDLTLPDGRAGRAAGVRFAAQQGDTTGGAVSGAEPPKGAAVTLVVARDRTDLNRILASFRIALNLFAVVLLGALAVLVAFVVRRGLAPLALVGERAAAIEATSLQVRFPADRMPEELHPIVQRLNDLLARLEKAFQRERRISADIAHELRTPLTELRTLVEVAIKWPEDTAGATKAFRSAQTIVGNMESMVESLLVLAQSEEGKLPINNEAVVVAELVEETWSSLAERARCKRLEFAADIPRQWLLYTDRALLRHILTNLLHNAVEYAPAGGWVRVQGGTRAAGFDLSVENTTDNLSADDLPHFFERFWRKDAARSGTSHGGLGLTLAQSVAAVLGMTLSAEMPGPDQLRVTLRGSNGARP